MTYRSATDRLTADKLSTGAVLGMVITALFMCLPAVQAADSAGPVVNRSYDLGGERSEAAQYYEMESRLMTHLPN